MRRMRSKLRYRLDIWEIIIAIICLMSVARFGPIPRVGGQFFTEWQILLSSLAQEYSKLLYLFGYLSLLGLTVISYARYHAYLFENVLLMYTAKVGGFFWGLLLLDWWYSPAEPYPYEKAWPVLYFGVLWHLIFLFIRPESASRLIKIATICAAVAAFYGVLYYLTGFRYVTLKGFGKRAFGVHYPNELYTISLIALPFSALLVWSRGLIWLRLLYSLSTSVIFAGLILTYTRSGWLALSGICAILFIHRPAFLSKKTLYGILILSILMLVGTLFVRTKGALMGHPADRSFHGRLAIWETALKVFEAHPLIGNGLTNYGRAQEQHMTSKLASFNIFNPEPKNLLLSILCEQGIVAGIVISALMVLLVAFLYTRVKHTAMMKSTLLSPRHALVIGGYLSLLASLLAGMTDTPVLHYSRSSATVLFIVYIACTVKIAHDNFDATNFSQVDLAREKRFLRGLLFAILAALAVIAVPTLSGVRAYLQNRPTLESLASGVSNHPISTIPQIVRDCVIASEDGYFLQHHGVDWQA
ncbi:MAG: O-antigen ligase family protein, partial [Armatimonadota bacterium]